MLISTSCLNFSSKSVNLISWLCKVIKGVSTISKWYCRLLMHACSQRKKKIILTFFLWLRCYKSAFISHSCDLISDYITFWESHLTYSQNDRTYSQNVTVSHNCPFIFCNCNFISHNWDIISQNKVFWSKTKSAAA